MRKVMNMILNNQMFLLKFLILLIVVQDSKCNGTVEVNLNQGVLSGTIRKYFLKNKEYYAFQGVPYAEPPIGELRFQPPKSYGKFEGTYEAYKNKPTCMQFSIKTRNKELFGISGSEDCLYLSIYTPSLEGNYPVVVFDFNDNFKTGFNGSKTYSPDFFIAEDVIVVYISHRLGLFGYLTTEDDVIPANNGVRDFLLGLNWIKDNIAKFGGDPSKVTLMGAKGGAALINILLYSEKAKGLFSAVILQSGTAQVPTYFYESPRVKAFEFAENLDIKAKDSNTLLEELQKVEAEKLLLNTANIHDSKGLNTNQRSAEIFALTVEKQHENAIITNLPENNNIVIDVPVLIGLTSREGIDLMADFFFEPRLLQQALGSISIHFPIRVNFRFDANSTTFNDNAFKEINEVYYKDGYLRVNLENMLEYAILLGDTFVGYAVDKTAKQLSKNIESPVYYYMFDFRGTLNENMENIARYSRIGLEQWGATVTDDLCYLHLCSRIKKTYKELMELVTEQTEFKVLKKMVRLWTNFAKTRNPTPCQEDNILKGITWIPIDKKSPEANYLHITKVFKMKKEPLGERVKFWDSFLDKYSKLAVDGVVSDPEGSVREENNLNDLKYDTDKETKDIKTKKEENEIDEHHKTDTRTESSFYENKANPVVTVQKNKVVVEIADSPSENFKPVNLPFEETHDEL